MRHLLTLALTTATLLVGISSANAFERHFTIDTPRGTIAGTTEVHCFRGACYREKELAGVNGHTLKRSSLCVRVAAGEWTCKSIVTGPKGKGRKRQVHIEAN